MRKFFNKPLAEYNLKDLIAVTGFSLLAVPVMWAFSISAINKTEEWKANRRKRKEVEDAEEYQDDSVWFNSLDKEEP